MRYGVIADIHGNLPALEESLAVLRRHGVDSFLCAGDLVGYGPHPNEVVETIAELDIPCVMGNHDQVVATGEGFDRVNELARRTLEWTHENISVSSREFLERLPVTREIEGEVVLAHGSVTDPWAYVRRSPDAWQQMAKLDRGRLLLLGHTHRQFVVPASRGATATSEGLLGRKERAVDLTRGVTAVINPGAVGQSRELRRVARFALLDVGVRKIHLFAVAYPYEQTVAALGRAGLPRDACHIRPRLKKAARQVVRDLEDRRQRADAGRATGDGV